MKKYKLLYHFIMNALTFIVGAFIFYIIVVYLNPKNNFHINKDMKIFLVIFGIVSIVIRYGYIEIKNAGPSIEDEIIEHMLRDANERFNGEEKKDKKEFKFLR